ncbi:effector-associated constant component EACC1 [Streptomyces sp. P6-2-1]|uniref:effector-associated constant component EACC1 n=1 Tax=Streptomyces sp. P6-2-1 TaxID=3422591 RepID=UPI003D35BA2C
MGEFRFETAGGAGGDGAGEEELRALYDWLRADRALRGGARFTPVRGAEPGRMGPGLEAVLALISTGLAFPQLLLSVDAWRQSRREARPRIVVIGPDADQVAALRQALGLPEADPAEERSAGEPPSGEPPAGEPPAGEPPAEPSRERS